jgi:PAS domain S-box-containing protein
MMTTEPDKLNQNSDDSFNLDLFFELSLDLLCIAGYDGYFKKINPAVSSLLGYSKEELFARPINEFIYVEDKDITSKYRESLKNSIPLLNFENRYIKKNGEVVWLSWTSIPVDSEKLVYAIAKDITYKKEIEDERNLLLTNLTKINNDLKQLTYATSHDLRSPVDNLLSVFNLLDVSKIQDNETIEFIAILKSTTNRLKDTLNNYVETLSQKDTMDIHVEELNLNTSLNVVLRSINSLIQSSRAIINVDFSAFETVKFNKAYLDSIFLNLLTNAIKYAMPDSCPVISIFSRRTAGVNQLIFSDKGLGFDMDAVKNKVFGLHQKFHNHIDSKGIGLYLVYNHVTSLGGHITLESKINEGAMFIISFKD